MQQREPRTPSFGLFLVCYITLRDYARYTCIAQRVVAIAPLNEEAEHYPPHCN